MSAYYNPWLAYFDGSDHTTQATDVDVSAVTDIDLNNSVDAAQATVIDADFGAYSHAFVADALKAAPEQSLAVGNFDGQVETGDVDVDALSSAPDGYGFGGYFGGYGLGDVATQATDIDVTAITDIDVVNNVTAVQNTVIDLDVGPGASVTLADALEAAPSQQIAVGNFGGSVDTGAPIDVDVDNFA